MFVGVWFCALVVIGTGVDGCDAVLVTTAIAGNGGGGGGGEVCCGVGVEVIVQRLMALVANNNTLCRQHVSAVPALTAGDGLGC